MNEFVEIAFDELTGDKVSVLIALLDELGYAGFEETGNGLKAYIPMASYQEDELASIANGVEARFSKRIIPETNWNALWESNFEPVIVDDFVGVRADFHDAINTVTHEIIITPKMSFGTGHHATTFMMVQEMKNIDFRNKTVFDFGTGTGILAILANKLGAKHIVAIDYDEWSIKNAEENISRNACRSIELQLGSEPVRGQLYDIILANINKHVILAHLETLAGQLAPGGVMLLSGLLPEDADDIFHNNGAYSLQLIQTTVRANWLCIKFSR